MNVLIRTLARELKQNPQSIRLWNLKDIIDMTADLINKSDELSNLMGGIDG